MYSMVYTTAPDEEEGGRIGREIVEKRLAACVNIFPIRSFYWWKGKVEEDGEQVMIFKTTSDLAPQVIGEVKRLSSYDVPCAVSYEMSGGEDNYLSWISESTSG